MARQDLQELYQHLMHERFRFMGPGEHKLQDVYSSVKSRYPQLCDDAYLCRDSCSSGDDQPEWKHTVRESLDALEREGAIDIELAAPQADTPDHQDRLSDLETHLAALMRSAAPDAFLIIEIAGTPDFLQFTATESMVQLDLPLVTERQALLEPKLRAIAQELDLELYESKGSGEDRFLDIDLHGTAAEIAPTVQEVLRRLYEVESERALHFECNNCEY